MAEAEIDVDKLPEGKGVYIGDTGEKAEHPTRLGDIIAMLESTEETDLPRINMLIALEIAYSLDNPKAEYNPRLIQEKVKALRELAKTLQEGEALSKKDFLNFDGPKFKYVLQELIILFKSSLKSAGFKEDDQNHVLRVFRDQLMAREPELRSETAKVTAESLFAFTAPTPEG